MDARFVGTWITHKNNQEKQTNVGWMLMLALLEKWLNKCQ